MTPPVLFSLRHREPNSFNWGFCEGFLGFASHRMLMIRWQREVHYAYIYMTLCIALNVLRGGCQREIPLVLPHWNTFLLYQAGIFERPSRINKPRKSVQNMSKFWFKCSLISYKMCKKIYMKHDMYFKRKWTFSFSVG